VSEAESGPGGAGRSRCVSAACMVAVMLRPPLRSRSHPLCALRRDGR
jgi:hypothetical protein